MKTDCIPFLPKLATQHGPLQESGLKNEVIAGNDFLHKISLLSNPGR